MAVPWRAAEAMHWQLGEQEMARRAGVVPFSLTATTPDSSSQGASRHQPKGHTHSRSQGSIFRETVDPSRAYGRSMLAMTPGPPPRRPLGPAMPRKESVPQPHVPMYLEHGEPLGYTHSHPGGGPLAPIQPQSQPRPGILPGLAELTTGVSPYSTPAYSVGVPSASPAHSATASPGPFLPALSYPPLEPAGSKRRRSPELGPPDPSRRRHLDSRPEAMDQSIPRHMP